MICPCKSRIACPGDDNPFTGFDSDADDCCTKIGVQYGIGGLLPALGSNWVNSNCVAFADSCDQQESDSKALFDYMHCVALNNRTPPAFDFVDPPDVPTPWDVDVFGNTPQTCSALCPDGLLFTFTVLADQFFALSQLEADRMAHSFACKQLVLNQVCMSGLIPPECCLNQTYSAFIVATGTFSPFEFSVVSGAIPPGMTLLKVSTSALKLSGNPSMSGTFNFTIKATDTHGNFMVKAYVLNVIAVASTPLPPSVVGTPYSFTFTTTGTLSGPASWSLASGALPAGLSMDSSGNISGTPTVAGDAAFTVQVSDGTVTCQKAFSVHTGGGGTPLVCPALIGTIAGVQAGTEISFTPTRTSAVRRFMVGDSAGVLRFINSATDTVIASPAAPFPGNSCCFATSTETFFIYVNPNVAVYSKDGAFIANILPSLPISGLAYSPTQDRVYGVAGPAPFFTHVLGFNPNTNTEVSNVDLGANQNGPMSIVFHLNNRLAWQINGNDLGFFDLPTMAFVGFVNFAFGGACYVPSIGKYLVGALNTGTFNAEIWEINPVGLTTDFVYTPTATGNLVISLEYNPVNGGVFAKQQAGLSQMVVIDPVARTIICEFIAGTDGNVGIDESSGKIYTSNDLVPQALIYQ